VPAVTANDGDRIEAAIAFALAQQGKRYVWATAGPNTFDCSGLVFRAFEHAGISFRGRPTTWSLVGMGIAVPRSQIRRGDLIFPDPGHVQIYLGAGQVIEAANSHVALNKQIRVAPMYAFWRARRLITGSISITQPETGQAPQAPSSIDPLQGAANSALDWASDPKHWYNLLMIILGVLLIIIALYRMAGNTVKDTVLEVVNA
jgi:cell wall-associated NlpC family hydrolase